MKHTPIGPYRVLYNQDCTHLFAVTREPITPGHVDRMVDEVAGGGADVMLINPGSQRTNYPSHAWSTFWEGYTPGDRTFFGPVPEKDIPAREAWVGQMKRLADQGCDYLARALARCRAVDVTPGISMRMNDMHDAPTPGSHLFSPFYMDHPEWRIDPPYPGGGWGARGLNYEHGEVREHFLALIREWVGAYDFDVLELDFLRFQCYFPSGDYDAHAAIMTGFIRDVRTILNGADRSIALIPRVAATPASAYELGFDVATWAREGLVQGVTTAAFLTTQWNLAVGEFKAITGGRMPVYAGMEYIADRRPDLPPRMMPLDPALLRGFAAGQLAAGADGIHVFNFFCAREEAWGAMQQPLFDALRDLKDLEHLRGRDKTVTVTTGWTLPDTDGPVQAPLDTEGHPRAFEVLMAAEPTGVQSEAVFLVAGGKEDTPGRLRLQVNEVPVGLGLCAEPADEKGRRRVVFPFSAEALQEGRNVLVLRSEGEAVTVVSLDIRVIAGQG